MEERQFENLLRRRLRALAADIDDNDGKRNHVEDIMAYVQDQQQPRRPHRAGMRRRTVISSVAAVIVVVLLAVSALYVFHTRSDTGGANDTNQGAFSSISMVSPTEGWAAGPVASLPGQLSVPLYHLKGGVWHGENVVLGLRDPRIEALSMDAATDGWAIGVAGADANQQQFVLHYDGKSWLQMRGPDVLFQSPLGNPLQAISATSVWLAGYEQPNARNLVMVHYDGYTWQKQPLSLPDFSRVNGIAMRSDSEGWVVGETDPSPTSGQKLAVSGFMFHDASGTWTQEASFPAARVVSVAWASPTELWATGYLAADAKTPNATFFHYHDGKWEVVPDPTDGPKLGVSPSVVMLSPSEGWAVASSVEDASVIMLHYVGGNWREIPLALGSGSYSIRALAFGSPDEGWAMGAGNGSGANGLAGVPVILHYHNGTWSLYH